MKLSDIRKLTRQLPAGESRAETAERNAILRSLGYEPGSLYQELEMDSRYVDTHQDASWSNFSVNLHSHSFYEVLYCAAAIPAARNIWLVPSVTACRRAILSSFLPESVTVPCCRKI